MNKALYLFCGFSLVALMVGCTSSEPNLQTIATPAAEANSSQSLAPLPNIENIATVKTSFPSTLINVNSPSPLSLVKPQYKRPRTADNGSPFPKNSGYIKGYPIKLKDGYSQVTVDNSQNSSDVFVKLYALESNPPQSIRVFFIRNGDKFTAKNIKAGNYNVRYQDLNYGGRSRTDSFNLKQLKTLEGITSSDLKLTLYKVANGNMKIHPISEQEF
jgi:hypothetical protein